MENVKAIIAKNIASLRKENKMTQMELAERLNYSDKAISRWERGDVLPDIDVLCQICDIFGVSFDYLTHEGEQKEKEVYAKKQERGNKIVIALLAETAVWTIAVLLFVYFKVIAGKNLWRAYIWAIPASLIVGIVFNGIWGRKGWRMVLISMLVWSFLAAVFIQFLKYDYNVWPVFLVGIPLQVAVILWANLGRKPSVKPPKEKKKKEKSADGASNSSGETEVAAASGAAPIKNKKEKKKIEADGLLPVPAEENGQLQADENTQA